MYFFWLFCLCSKLFDNNNNRHQSPILAEIGRPITKILPNHFVIFERFLEGICMFTKHVGYMGNWSLRIFKQLNMYCGKSALLKGQETPVNVQENVLYVLGDAILIFSLQFYLII